jgi:hypothetical protein
MTKRLLPELKRALGHFQAARDNEAAGDKAFGRLVDLVFREFTEKEWRSFYSLNDRLFERSKTKRLKRREYPIRLLMQAVKILEQRR